MDFLIEIISVIIALIAIAFFKKASNVSKFIIYVVVWAASYAAIKFLINS